MDWPGEGRIKCQYCTYGYECGRFLDDLVLSSGNSTGQPEVLRGRREVHLREGPASKVMNYSSTPQVVPNLNNVTSIGCGAYYNLAAKSDGSVCLG